MFRFASPYLLLLLLAVPLLLWWVRYRDRRRRPRMRYSSILRLHGVGPTWRTRLMWVPWALRGVAMAALIVALARPQTGIGEIRTTADGVAIMLVIDRSSSMNEPMGGSDRRSRINVVKEVCGEFIAGNDEDLAGRTEDLMGAVTFGRFADTICPLVKIHDTLVQLVDELELAQPNSMEDGTAIGEGIALAAARLKDTENELRKRNEGVIDPEFEIKSKVIVLMTDGEENVNTIPAGRAATLCAEWGIKIYAIGIGSGQNERIIRTPFGTQRLPSFGTFNERLLNEVATTTGGAYWTVEDADALAGVYETIDELEKTDIASREFTSYNEAFEKYAFAGAALLLLEMLLTHLILRRVP
ncbi:MAG: VWA domain-containing protein [Planctomycetes bacterium]|nr:VWA domain-containing protein [Planctomycetota bacterium]NOG55832.1 VWA domain-containing protein [Planctomycetota bacterium]